MRTLRLTSVTTDESYDIEVPARSLYIIRNKLRYDFNHAILGPPKNDVNTLSRRVSLIFRDIHPNDEMLYNEAIKDKNSVI